jgi:hypothetical protein
MKSRNYKKKKKTSQFGLCTLPSENANVKVQNIQHEVQIVTTEQLQHYMP